MRTYVHILALAVLLATTPAKANEAPLCEGLSFVESYLTPELGVQLTAIAIKSLECAITLRGNAAQQCEASLQRLIRDFCRALETHPRQPPVTG